MAKKNQKYTFLEKNTGGKARTALILSAISGGLLGILILISFIFQGQADIAIGAFGLIGAILAVFAFVPGMQSLAERKDDHRLATAAALVSGFLVIGWGALFLMGLH